MGENTAVILDPKSAPTTATKPIGTGPFKFDNWAKGSAVTLSKFDGYRDAAKVKLKKVTFRFINDPAAQVAALLAGDIDGMPRFGAPQNLKQFQGDPRFSVQIGGTEGKTIVSINNKKKPFDDVRVRRAIAAAIDRKAVIDGAMEGFGAPIGSRALPDHDDFSALPVIRGELVCTEKDAVKLWRTRPDAWAVPLVVEIGQSPDDWAAGPASATVPVENP